MKRSGFEDPEQQMHVPRHHLHDLQTPEMNYGGIDSCMLNEKKQELAVLHSQFGDDRLEGISKRHQVVKEAASNRHIYSAGAASVCRAPKRLESRGLEASGEPTKRPDLVKAKLAEELFDEGMDLNNTSELKLSAKLSRTCRICNKQFPSGRALGGHMRVHGPLFIPASSSSALTRRYGVGANPTVRREDAHEYGARADEDDDGSPSIVDALDQAELGKDFPLQDACSPQAARYSSHGADRTVLLDPVDPNGYAGESDADHADSDEQKDLNFIEPRLLSLINNTSHISYLEVAARTDEANPTVRKSLLYKLRHNPKRSRWFVDQEFAFDASMTNLSDKNPAEGGSVICSECGKAFSSERALFGHMRCHSDRDRRVMLTPDGISSEQPANTMARQRRKSRLLIADKFMSSSEMQIGSKKEEVYETEVEASMETRNKAVYIASAGIGVIGPEDLTDKREAEVLGMEDNEQHGCISSPARWQRAGRRSRRKVGLSKAGTTENWPTSSSSPEDETVLTSETITLEPGVEEQEVQTPDFLILLADAAQKVEEETEMLLSREKVSHLRTDVKRSKHQQMDAADRRPHREDTYSGEHEDVPPVLHAEHLVSGTSIGKYECTTCKKSFNSHQALGGHRASHKKTKGCFARTGSSEASDEHLLEEELELSHVQEKATVSTHKKSRQQMQQAAAFRGHACSICQRVFLTGQALGGHKRCHWTGEKPSEAASIASTNKQFSMQSEGQSMVEGGIDLNMPAPMDDDDDDADEVGFAPAETHLINGEIETEVEEKDVSRSDNLVLGTSALAWTVKDLLKEDTCSSPPQKETEVRRRFDGIWGQHWPNNIARVTQLHQPMYAMQSLV